jgi:hypothetical protein
VAEKGPDFKPGPQITPTLVPEESEDENGNGEGPSNAGLPSNVKDLMDPATGDASNQNGDGQNHGETQVAQRDGEDVVMGEASHEQTNGAAPESDPIQEQLAMEMAGHAQHNGS